MDESGRPPFTPNADPGPQRRLGPHLPRVVPGIPNESGGAAGGVAPSVSYALHGGEVSDGWPLLACHHQAGHRVLQSGASPLTQRSRPRQRRCAGLSSLSVPLVRPSGYRRPSTRTLSDPTNACPLFVLPLSAAIVSPGSNAAVRMWKKQTRSLRRSRFVSKWTGSQKCRAGSLPVLPNRNEL